MVVQWLRGILDRGFNPRNGICWMSAMLSQENVTIWINDDETCFVLDQMRWGGSSFLY
jgi:hypothetical protein